MNAANPVGRPRAQIIQLLLHDMTDAVTLSNPSQGGALSVTDISTAAARHLNRMRGPDMRSPQPTRGGGGRRPRDGSAAEPSTTRTDSADDVVTISRTHETEQVPTHPLLSDLGTRADIDALLQHFYTDVTHDDLLRHIFIDVAQMDVKEHLPVIGDFWEKVLFNTGNYTGNAMRVHRHLSRRETFTPALFERWLALWDRAVDHRHQGVTATQAKHHAARIALAIKRNLNQSTSVRAPPQRARLHACPDHRLTRLTCPASAEAIATTDTPPTATSSSAKPTPSPAATDPAPAASLTVTPTGNSATATTPALPHGQDAAADQTHL